MAEYQNITNYSDKKILLHACCGICSSYPISLLKSIGYEVVVYFFNPNIYPDEEYEKRLNAQKTVCEHFGCKLITEDYNPKEYYDAVKGYENEPEKGHRCNICFNLRLNHAAQKALELGIRTFTTSIVISPHKDYLKISQIGKNIAQNFGLEYLDINFRKHDGFLKTNQISKELELYRQKYCGCKFSMQK